MNAKIISILAGSLCLSSLAFADNGYSSSQQPSRNGYVSSQSSSSPTSYTVESQQVNHHRRNGIYVSVDSSTAPMMAQDDTYFVPAHAGYYPPRYYRKMLAWIDTRRDDPMPMNAVIGGEESNGGDLFICHANYHGGIHPGKVVAGNCNISWGGREVSLPRYQVLVSQSPLNWISANGFVPNAIVGGFERGRPLYICQADYNGGTHPGKIVGNRCNIGWGGKEIALNDYNVLVK